MEARCSADRTEREVLSAAIGAHEAALRRRMAAGTNPLFDSGLTIQQLRVLVLLAADGPLAQGDLAQALGVGVATVTGIVDRLVARGLVERTEDTRDRRVRRAALSVEGGALLDKIQTAGQEFRRHLLDSIDVDALRALEKGLKALRDAVREEPAPSTRGS